MNTNVTIVSTEPLKQQKVQQSRRQSPKEAGASDNSANPDFGLLICQLAGAGMAQQSSPQPSAGGEDSENTAGVPTAQPSAPSPGAPGQELATTVETAPRAFESSPIKSRVDKESDGPVTGERGNADKTAKVDALPETSAAPQAPAVPPIKGAGVKESAGTTPGENGSLDKTAKKNKDLDKPEASQFPEPLPHKGDAKNNAAGLASPDKVSPNNAVHTETDAPVDKKIVYLASPTGGKDSESQQGSEGSRVKSEVGEKRPGAGTLDGNHEKTDFASLVTRESSLTQQQSGAAVGERGPGTAEGSQHVSAHAGNPVQNTENTVSIVKDGDRLAVKIEPDGLGKININLSLDNGKVHAQIDVQDSATKNLIENNKQQIMDALIQEGLSVGGFSVSLNKGDAGRHMAENVWKSAGKGNGTSREPISTANKAASMGLVNIFA